MAPAQSENNENKKSGRKLAHNTSPNWRERDQEKTPTNSNNPGRNRRYHRESGYITRPWRQEATSREESGMDNPENQGEQNQTPARPWNSVRIPRPQATAPPRKSAPQPASTRLTPEAAKPGRIVWMPKFKENSIAKAHANEGAAEHPAVIMGVDPDENPPTVTVLPITSWDDTTVKEKWWSGKGVEFQKFYILIWHDDEETKRAVEGQEKIMNLSNMSTMRKRSYITCREGTIKIEMENLDLYTNNGNPDIFLTSDSFNDLRKFSHKMTLERLNAALPPLEPQRPPRPPFHV